MKLIYLTDRYGDRIMIRPLYGGPMLFFAGDHQPKYQELVTIELPGLVNEQSDSMVAWLKANMPMEQPDSRRQIFEFPAHVWRKTVLDDFLDAANYHYGTWWMNRLFSLAEFSAFADKWLPQVQEKMREISAVPKGQEQIAALDELRDLADRVFAVMAQAPQRIANERADLMHDLESVQVQALRQGGFEVDKWLETAESIQTPGILLSLLGDITSHLI